MKVRVNSNKQYAEQIGKTVAQLTEQERQTAFVVIATEEAIKVANNTVKGKYPLYVGDYVSEIELVSTQPIGNSNEISLGFKITDEKVIDIIKQQDKKMINSSVSFIDGE